MLGRLESKSRPPHSLCVWEGEEPSRVSFLAVALEESPHCRLFYVACCWEDVPSMFTQPRSVLGSNPGVLGAWEERTVQK